MVTTARQSAQLKSNAKRAKESNVLDNEAKRLANQSRVLFNEYVANLTTTRQELFRKLMDPRRDLDQECGYLEEITLEDYGKMYDREGIGQRVVSIWPDESWIQDPSIDENEDEVDTPFEAAWKMLEERLNLFHYMHRVDELSGIGAFGVVLLGLSDGKALHEPVPGIQLTGPKAGQRVGDTSPGGEPTEAGPQSGPRSSKLKLNYVRVFDQRHVAVASFETDEKSPRFGQPNHYNITLTNPNVMATSGTQAIAGDRKDTKVHWTRVIHIADNRKSNEVFGVPRQQAVWNRLMDIRKLLGGSAEMFWKGAFPGYSFETQPELGEVDIDVDALRDEFAEFSNGLNRFLATSGITAKSLAPQVADPENHVMIQIRALAVQVGVPWRQFIGSEQAQLASDQDRDNLNKRITRRRSKYLSPWVVRPFVDRLITLGVLPEPTGESRVEEVEEPLEEGRQEPETGQDGPPRRDRVRPAPKVDPEAIQKEMETALPEDDELTDVGSYPYSVNWPDLEEASPLDKATWAQTIAQAMALYIQAGAHQLVPEKEFLTKVLGFEEDEAEAFLKAAEAVIEEMEAEQEKEFEQQKELIQAKGPNDDPENGPPNNGPPQPPPRR